MLNDLELQILQECYYPTIGMSDKFRAKYNLSKADVNLILDKFIINGLLIKEEISLKSTEYCPNGFFIYKITALGGYFLRNSSI